MNHAAKLIVFDWDGTLMDSEARIVDCLRAAIADMQLPHRTDNELRNIIGLGLQEALRTLYPELDSQQHGQLTAQYREHFLGNQQAASPLFEGARALLEELHQQDYLLAVATGKGRAGLDKVLDETGLREYFHFTRCADESFSKPHPQMMLDILDWLGVEANEAVMVGDTEYDLQMAHNAGVSSVAVSYGVHEKSRLLACKPKACVDNIQQLRNWLLNEKVDAA